MANSEYLKAFKALWGQSCHGMWVELLCTRVAESYVITNYSTIPSSKSIDEMFYSPELDGRINDLNPDVFLRNLSNYREDIVTNRVVILSASFEAYFGSFLDAYINNREKYFDISEGKRSKEGNKLYGEVIKVSGLVPRIQKFVELTGAGIKTIESLLDYLSDVYLLRNVLAHQAGVLDQYASDTLKNIILEAGKKIVITPSQLVELAEPVVRIAEFLDRKIISEYDPNSGKHRAVKPVTKIKKSVANVHNRRISGK